MHTTEVHGLSTQSVAPRYHRTKRPPPAPLIGERGWDAGWRNLAANRWIEVDFG